jgi:hypothetical protein
MRVSFATRLATPTFSPPGLLFEAECDYLRYCMVRRMTARGNQKENK